MDEINPEGLAETHEVMLSYYEWRDAGLAQFFKHKQIKPEEFTNFLETYEATNETLADSQ